MRSAGFTFLELLLGVALTAILGVVSARLLQAGLKTYSYTARQAVALSTGAAALRGEGTRPGLVVTARSAKTISSLSPTSLVVTSPSAVVTTFTVSNGALTRTSSLGSLVFQASGVEPLAVNYYNIDGAGLIVESTVAAWATMATFNLNVRGLPGSSRSYNLFSGVGLRNHP